MAAVSRSLALARVSSADFFCASAPVSFCDAPVARAEVDHEVALRGEVVGVAGGDL